MAAVRGHQEIAEYLITNGNARLNDSDEQGRSPLDLAVENQHKGTAVSIQEHGGNCSQLEYPY